MNRHMKTLVVLLFSTVLSAEQTSSYLLSVASVSMSMDYREYDDNDHILDSEKSDFSEMIGGDFSIDYTKALESKNYAKFGANLMFLSGNTEYVGSYIDSNLGYGSIVATSKNSILDTSIGYTFHQVFDSGIELSYGVGLGYRSWKRQLSRAQIEKYTWYSFRQKTGIAYSLKKFRLGASFEYQHGINPRMKILADSQNPDTTVNLRSANIIELTIPIELRVYEKIVLFTEYVYQHQAIEKSNTESYIFNGTTAIILEPRSTADNQYLKFGATFKF